MFYFTIVGFDSLFEVIGAIRVSERIDFRDGLVGLHLRRNLCRIHNVITVLIWVLLFILGVEVGGNEQIIKGLHTIGIEAIILTLGGTLGSVIAAWALWKALYKKKGEAA